MNALVVSPHYDDAVWSVGAHLSLLTSATVVTIFARRPSPGLLTAFDQSCGFKTDSHDAVATRRVENIRACTVIAVSDLDGPFSDSQYGEVTPEDAVAGWLTALLHDSDYDTVIAPLGIGHQDHRVAAAAARVAARQRGRYLTVYEELPYRVWYPEETVRCLDEIRAGGWGVNPTRLDTPGPDEYDTKAAAVECYRSQIDRPIRATLSVPERVWDLTWNG